MAHMLNKGDAQEGTEMGWHKLTKVRPDLHAQFMDGKTHLDSFDVFKSPLFVGVPGNNPANALEYKQTEFCQLVCTDDPSYRVGNPVHCTSYGLITNAAFTKIVRNSIKEMIGAEVVSTGTVCSRGRLFVSIKLKEMEEFQVRGQTYVPFLNFQSSHDLSSPFTVNTSNTKTVCNNTFSMDLQAIGGQRSGIKSAEKNSVRGQSVKAVLKHSKNVAERLENIPDIVSGFLGANAIFQIEMEKLAAQPIKIQDVTMFFTGLLTGKNETKKVSTRRENQVNRLTELFSRGNGNLGKDRSDLFNAGTDFYTHESSGGENIEKQFLSSEFGTGNTRKQALWDTLINESKFDKAMAKGEAVLSAV